VHFGDTETWTLLNQTGEQHVFHIHQVPFQVVEINGQAVPFTGYQDTITIPVEDMNGPGEVKVIIPFDDPAIIGKFMYHCHISEHSDAGMMATIVVQR
jgi:suppressor of ftsI